MNTKVIDLESSEFFSDGKRSDDWYKAYCNIANSLSQQGFLVMVSSHGAVCKELLKSAEKVLVCYPSVSLRDFWVHKLRKRYVLSVRCDEPTFIQDRNFKAYANAVDQYEENIVALSKSGFPKMEIDSSEYDLLTMIKNNL